MSKENGSPAFPSANNVRIGDMTTGGHSGMTLRDYFAAMAMQVSISGLGSHPHPMNDAPLAEAAYRVADAMLAARVKP